MFYLKNKQKFFISSSDSDLGYHRCTQSCIYVLKVFKYIFAIKILNYAYYYLTSLLQPYRPPLNLPGMFY